MNSPLSQLFWCLSISSIVTVIGFSGTGKTIRNPFSFLVTADGIKSTRLFGTRDDATKHPSKARPLVLQENDLIELYETARYGVAYISKLSQTFNPILMNVMEVPSLSGSGFVWNSEYLVTNYHVIQNQKEVLVTFTTSANTRESYKATIRGFDKERDIAVLKLIVPSSMPSIPPAIPLGESKSLRVGQYALAIGNPFGLDQTLTSGIISGLGRQVKSPSGSTIYDMIQIDAAINPGNSGGPLLDSSGSIIGMNTAIYSPSGAFAGVRIYQNQNVILLSSLLMPSKRFLVKYKVGFAIPVDTLKVVADFIIKNGVFSLPSSGIEFLGINQGRLFGVTRGLMILSIAPGSPAEKAGLRPASRNGASSADTINTADIVTAVNGNAVNTEADFLQTLLTKSAGDMITITIMRRPVSVSSADTAKIPAKELDIRLVLGVK